MKYQVQIKFSNPAHEHVSLRRRVDTITRIVEASSEDEAINRGANQQRALGFLIREAAVIKSENEEKETKKKKKVVGDDNEKTDVAVSGGVKEGFDPEPSDIAAHLVKKHGKGKVTKDHVDAYEKDRDSNKGIDKEAVMKHVQKMSEEVELVDEQSPAEIKAKYYHDQFNKVKPVKAYDKEGKLVGRYRSMDHAKQMKPGHTYKVEEELELDEAQKKLRPSYWKAEWRLGTQSEVDKNNKKIFDKLAKTDPVKASAFHNNLMRMKKKDVKEEVEQIDEAFDKSFPAHAKAQELVSNYGNRSAMRAVYHGDGTATIHTTGDKKVSSATRVDHIHDQAGLGYNRPAAEYKNSSKSKGGLKFKTKETEGKSIYGSHEIHISHKGMKEEVEISEASKEGKDVMRNMRASLKSMDLRHGVDSDKRDAGYKMSPAVKAAQAKSDALSKVVKRPQAGTLAAVKMKKEEVEDNGKKKARNAAEKMVNAAKGKANKINLEPTIDLTKKKEA